MTGPSLVFFGARNSLMLYPSEGLVTSPMALFSRSLETCDISSWKKGLACRDGEKEMACSASSEGKRSREEGSSRREASSRCEGCRLPKGQRRWLPSSARTAAGDARPALWYERSVNQFVQDLARLKREKATSGLLRALTEPFQFLFAKSSTFGSRLILVVWLHGRQEGPNWADDVWPQLRVAASDCI